MQRQEIKELVIELVGGRVEFKDYPKWVTFPCVFAPWKHERGRDASPSAGVSITDGMSFYNCYSCKAKGPLSQVLRQLSSYNGEDYSGLIEELKDGEFLGGTIGEWGAVPEAQSLAEPLDEEVYLDLYDSAEGHEYLRERGISGDTARKLGLLYDPDDGHGADRILFPVYSHQEQLYGFTGRAISEDVEPRIRDYHGLPKRFLLLGAHLIRPGEHSHVNLVEGLFDYAKMWEHGEPTVASMKSDLSQEQADILKDIGLPVYCFYDNDAAGVSGMASVKERLCKYLPVMKVRYPKRVIWGQGIRGGRQVKDPGELTSEEVQAMRGNARLL